MPDIGRENRDDDSFDLGGWLGRRQAFSLVAGTCAAADAKCIYEIRKQEKYKLFGMTWERFCKERLGMHRSKADQIIRQWEELGANFFTLAQATRITAGEYRRIRGSISGQALLHGGESIPIEPENAPRLSAAIADLRRTARKAAPPVATVPPAPPLDAAAEAGRAFLQAERALRAAMREVAGLDAGRLDLAGRLRLRTLLGDGVDQLRRLEMSIRV